MLQCTDPVLICTFKLAADCYTRYYIFLKFAKCVFMNSCNDFPNNCDCLHQVSYHILQLKAADGLCFFTLLIHSAYTCSCNLLPNGTWTIYRCQGLHIILMRVYHTVSGTCTAITSAEDVYC